MNAKMKIALPGIIGLTALLSLLLNLKTLPNTVHRIPILPTPVLLDEY